MFRKFSVGGDFILTMYVQDIWGKNMRIDPLMDFFNNLFESMILVIVALVSLGPTWTNRRSGDEGIEKRLDHFIYMEVLLKYLYRLILWIMKYHLSYHYLVILQLDMRQEHINFPFKFNLNWNQDEEFVDLFKREWNRLFIITGRYLVDYLVHNFISVKKSVKNWEKEKKS